MANDHHGRRAATRDISNIAVDLIFFIVGKGKALEARFVHNANAVKYSE
jgi:hypothetical protein